MPRARSVASSASAAVVGGQADLGHRQLLPESGHPGRYRAPRLARPGGRPASCFAAAATREGGRHETKQLLAGLAAALAGGGIRVVDLSQTLRPSTPVIQLPPPLAPSQPFRIEEISRYDERGPAWYWNNISCGEHTGTHFDAPAHWITGRELAGRAYRHHPAAAPGRTRLRDRLLARRSRPTRSSCSSPPHVEAWEAAHGRIPAGAGC